jgi:ankyrin repeat protein
MFLPHDDTPPQDCVGGVTEPHNSTIQQAAANDDLAKVSEFLDSGVDVNSRDKVSKTALYWAICIDSPTIVQLLLSRGADTSLRDGWDPDWPDGFTPVENAARQNSIAAMQELLAYGVDIEASNAVCFAAQENHAEMLRLLFEKTESSMSDVARQQAFATALRESAGKWCREILRWVLKTRGDERALDDHWQSALNCAYLQVFHELFTLPADILSQKSDRVIQVLEILVEAGASINAHTDGPSPCTALYFALELDLPLKLIAFLLDHGADVNFCGPGKRSLFFQLLGYWRETEELIKMFTDAGAVIGPPDDQGQTPLHCVPKASIASWLLASGADISAVDNQGEIPLHKASSASNVELVSLYLEAGTPTDPDQRNNLGWTPFMQSSSVNISKAMIDRGANIHATSNQGITAIHRAAEVCNLELVSFLLSNGANIHAASNQGVTAIHNAAEACDPELVSFLLANGANVHARALRQNRRSDPKVEHNTPLHLAVTSARGAWNGGTLEVVIALLDHGADIEAKDGDGKTPLLLAVSTEFNIGGRHRPDQVPNYLLERGADPHAVDNSGKSAVQLGNEKHYPYYEFSETGKFERKLLSPRSRHDWGVRHGRGRGGGRRLCGRGGLHS